jgi:hypothetical protein
MSTQPLKLTCIEYQKPMKFGDSRPFSVDTEDEAGNTHQIVLKLRYPASGNHFEGTSLACELICAVIARTIGLSVPNFAIVDVNREFVESVRQQDVRELLRRNIGKNFGTVYQEGASGWIPEIQSDSPLSLVEKLESILAFDSAIFNADRKRPNSNLIWDGQEIFLIDHSLALFVHTWTAEQLAKIFIFPDDQIQQHCTYLCLAGRKREFKALWEKWTDDVSESWLDDLRVTIPSNWEKNSGDLDKIFLFLKERANRFSHIRDHLRRIMQ